MDTWFLTLPYRSVKNCVIENKTSMELLVCGWTYD